MKEFGVFWEPLRSQAIPISRVPSAACHRRILGSKRPFPSKKRSGEGQVVLIGIAQAAVTTPQHLENFPHAMLHIGHLGPSFWEQECPGRGLGGGWGMILRNWGMIPRNSPRRVGHDREKNPHDPGACS